MGKRFSTTTLLGVLVTALIAACNERNPPTSPSSRTTYTLSGMVSESTAAGLRAVAGALVRAGTTGRSATTDGAGVYAIPDVPAGEHVVTVSADGYGTATRTVLVNGDTRVDIEIVRPAPYALTGRVYEVTGSGEVPIQGADVHEGMTHFSSRTDADGVYRIEQLPGGSVYLYVTKEGYQPHASQFFHDRDMRRDIQLVRR